MTPISQPLPDANPQAAHLATSDLHLARIVVGIDFSAPATAAFKAAISIGKIYEAEILLVHAVTSFFSNQEQEPTAPNAFHATLERAKTEMKWLIANEPLLRGVAAYQHRMLRGGRCSSSRWLARNRHRFQQTNVGFETQQKIAIVQLIEALGGGWDTAQLPSRHAIRGVHLTNLLSCLASSVGVDVTGAYVPSRGT